MTIRTTADEVASVIDASCEIDLRPFIVAANILTDRVSSCATEKGYSLSSEELRTIEQYLAAHFYGLRDGQYQSKSTERASATFQGKTGLGLDLTWWGQTAKMFDTSGCLSSFGSSGTVASLTWLGKPPSDQLHYTERD